MTSLQRSAYSKIYRLVRTGELPDPRKVPCFDCGERAREYHHFIGYEYPLHVLPLCHSCHFKREPRYTNRKLAPEVVRDIRASQETDRVLANRYGVHRSAISFVRTRRTYRKIA